MMKIIQVITLIDMSVMFGKHISKVNILLCKYVYINIINKMYFCNKTKCFILFLLARLFEEL